MEHGTHTNDNHAALWHGRFLEGPDAEAVAFETSIHIDERLAHDDIIGSIAHVQMLAKQNIIPSEDSKKICDCLLNLDKELESGTLKIDYSAEDIHSFIEATLTDRIGEVGKKIHTGRSRNDQIALDERLYLRRIIPSLQNDIITLVETLILIAEKNMHTLMPGFTHLQHAQGVTLAHHLCAYSEGLKRDYERLDDCLKRIMLSPLGSGALAGTTLPLDRNFVAEKLGFEGITANSLDSVSDRDYCIELASCLAILQMHLSRFCEEIVLWSSQEFSFIELSEKWSTGSSIMPQKKNPDFAELIRGRTGKVYGSLVSLLVMMKALPLSYNRDMQEDKESLFSAIDTVQSCLKIFSKMVGSATWNTEHMKNACLSGYLNATDLAEYLVKKGMPFRSAHEVSALCVRLAIEKNCALEELSLNDFKLYSALFEDDIFSLLDAKTCTENRKIPGAPASECVEKEIENLKLFVKGKKK